MPDVEVLAPPAGGARGGRAREPQPARDRRVVSAFESGRGQDLHTRALGALPARSDRATGRPAGARDRLRGPDCRPQGLVCPGARLPRFRGTAGDPCARGRGARVSRHRPAPQHLHAARSRRRPGRLGRATRAVSRARSLERIAGELRRPAAPPRDPDHGGPPRGAAKAARAATRSCPPPGRRHQPALAPSPSPAVTACRGRRRKSRRRRTQAPPAGRSADRRRGPGR